MVKFLYEFFDLGPPGELEVKRRKALESITDSKPEMSVTYDYITRQLDRPIEHPLVFHRYGLTDACTAYLQECTKTITPKLKEYLTAQGLKLEREAPDVQYPACLIAEAKLKPREEGFAEVLLPMFETNLHEDLQVPDVNVQNLMHNKRIEWGPGKALHISNCRFVLSKGQMYYIHIMYKVKPMGESDAVGNHELCVPKCGH